MSEQENEKYQIEIIKKISQVPGVIGFIDILSTSNSPKVLGENNLSKGIKIISKGRSVLITLHIISSIELRTKIIIKEISSNIKYFLKERDFSLKSLNVFIRGVK